MPRKLLLPLLALFVLIGGGIYLISRPKDAATQTVQKKNLLALGDSVAAGVGLPTASDISQCDRTEESYPAVLAAKLGYSFESYACSGATISEGLTGSQKIGNGSVPAQFDQAAQATPDIITLTIGANDVGWSAYLTKCAIALCGDNQDTQELSTKLALLDTNLSSAIEKLHSVHSAPIYLTSYYRLYPDANSACTQPSIFEDSELKWINSASNSLNSTLKQIADRYDYVSFVSTDFSNHTLCDSTPWLQDFNSPAPYHPNQDGQITLANQIYTEIKK
jgi:lysophospholipase L1-like esterase